MDVAQMLKQSSLFAELSDADIRDLAQSTRSESYKPGRIILREGHTGAAFYVLVSGKVEVLKDAEDGEDKVVATLGAGDFFGEATIMKHVSRTATVRAAEDTVCLVIRRLDLQSFFERYPVVEAKIETAISRRNSD